MGAYCIYIYYIYTILVVIFYSPDCCSDGKLFSSLLPKRNGNRNIFSAWHMSCRISFSTRCRLFKSNVVSVIAWQQPFGQTRTSDFLNKYIKRNHIRNIFLYFLYYFFWSKMCLKHSNIWIWMVKTITWQKEEKKNDTHIGGTPNDTFEV